MSLEDLNNAVKNWPHDDNCNCFLCQSENGDQVRNFFVDLLDGKLKILKTEYIPGTIRSVSMARYAGNSMTRYYHVVFDKNNLYVNGEQARITQDGLTAIMLYTATSKWERIESATTAFWLGYSLCKD